MKQNIINLFRCTIALAALLIASTASAVVSESYKITKADTQNGSYSVTVNGEEAETAVAGATVTITATPDTGYEVDGTPVVSVTTDWGRANARAMTRGEIPTEGTVAVTAGTTAGTWTFTMPNDDVTVSLAFKKSNYAISVSTVDGGSISAKKGDAAVTTAQYGDSITLGNTPSTGWQFVSYSVKDAADNAVTVTNGKFAMPAGAVTVSATFSMIDYTVTIAEGITGGSISANKTTANYGDTITLGNTPNTGWQFASYSVKDAASNPIEVKNGKFAMPAGAVTVSATFSKINYAVTIAESITGGAVTADKTIANYGDTITLGNTPSTGWQFASYSVKDAADNAVTVTNGKFAMPAGAVTVSATFVLAGYEITVGPGEYATFFKEVALYVEDEDAELYTIANVTATEAQLSDAIKVAPAETPLLVYNKSEQDKTFLLIPTTENADEVTPAKEFKGSLTEGEIPASSAVTDYYALNGKAFVWVKYAIEIGANKCWLQIGDQPAAARAMTRSIVGGGNTTNMDDVRWQMEDGNYYDLQGRKVEKPNRKGIYIHNGQKVIVR